MAPDDRARPAGLRRHATPVATAFLFFVLGACTTLAGPGAGGVGDAAKPGLATCSPGQCSTRRVSPGAVLLVRTDRHLRVALKTAAQLKAARPRQAHIIVCGEAVLALRRGSPLASELATAGQQGIRVVACGLALQEQGVQPGDLAESVAVVDNGLVEAISLQEQGLVSVEL